MAKTNRKVALELGSIVMQNADELLSILESLQRKRAIVRNEFVDGIALMRSVDDILSQVSGRLRFVEMRESCAASDRSKW